MVLLKVRGAGGCKVALIGWKTKYTITEFIEKPCIILNEEFEMSSCLHVILGHQKAIRSY